MKTNQINLEAKTEYILNVMSVLMILFSTGTILYSVITLFFS